MADSEETISLKDRYESLKILCSEQVLANELLKDEVDRLRKCFHEISMHRTFLLDKLLSLQSSSATGEDSNLNRTKSSNSSYASKRAPATQRLKTSSSYGQGSHRGKGTVNELQSYDESDRESDSWQPGEPYNGWDDQLRLPDYRRSMKQRPKSRPSTSYNHSSSSNNPTSFKRPRLSGGNVGAPYPPSNSSRIPEHFHPTDDRSPGFSQSDDHSEEPPVIYSAAVTKSEIQRNSNNVLIKPPHHRIGISPNIIKSPSSSSTGNSLNSVQISGNPTSGTRIYLQKPSVPGGYVSPRMH